MLSRRNFINRASLAAATTGLALAEGSKARAANDGPKAPKIIHLVADGMSMGTLTCADHLSQIMRKRPLAWTELLNRPKTVSALVNMRPLNSLVTDSAAAASSWGTGSRIANGALGILPDGRKLKTLCEVLGAEGWKRGLVTTTEMTHATPAGFAANVPQRKMAEKIAEQYLGHKIEVLLGGGRKHFDGKKRKDKKDLYGSFRKQGYAVLNTAADLAKAPPGKSWLGTFSESHHPYTVDRENDAALKKEVPTLATMTRAALKKLNRSDKFILQIEGGRVDHGCHSCDSAAAFRDLLSFDEAVEACLDFQKQNPETLIVITTDHGNGNPGLNGTGGNYVASTPLFGNIKDATASFSVMLGRMGKTPTIAQIQQIVRESTGYQASKQRAEMLAPFLNKKGKALYGLMNSPVGQLGQLMANHWAVGWAGSAHTSDYVPLTAIGPGAEKFRGFIDNTDVFHNYMALAGVDFKNPTVPLSAKASKRIGSPENIEEYWA
jgi:alkaline phosphatase